MLLRLIFGDSYLWLVSFQWLSTLSTPFYLSINSTVHVNFAYRMVILYHLCSIDVSLLLGDLTINSTVLINFAYRVVILHYLCSIDVSLLLGNDYVFFTIFLLFLTCMLKFSLILLDQFFSHFHWFSYISCVQ